MNAIVPKDFFDQLWKVNVYFLRAKFKRWKNQRCYFVAAENSFIWKVLEEEIKNPDDLPKDHILVNAIYTGNIFRRPGGSSWDPGPRFTVLEFRDIIYSWVTRKGVQAQTTLQRIFMKKDRNNKKRQWAFTIEEVFSGGLTLKKMKVEADFAYTGRSLAEEAGLSEAL